MIKNDIFEIDALTFDPNNVKLILNIESVTGEKRKFQREVKLVKYTSNDRNDDKYKNKSLKFLSNDEIHNIKQYVPKALSGVPILIVAECKNGNPIGFMRIANQTLEMLFVANESRGQGIGRQLLQYGIENYSVCKLSVNEQNPLAKGFYEHMGFTVYKRTQLDEQGNPYPLLYMKRD